VDESRRKIILFHNQDLSGHWPCSDKKNNNADIDIKIYFIYGQVGAYSIYFPCTVTCGEVLIFIRLFQKAEGVVADCNIASILRPLATGVAKDEPSK